MPGRCRAQVARRARGRTAAGAVLPCRLHAAGRAIADIAYQNKAVIYDLLFKASAETMLTIAADPKHLGARIGITAVLHTWGSALTHHPHVHMIVPGGGLSPDGKRWIACRPGFFLPVRVLSRLFRAAVAGEARRRAQGRQAHVLRRSRRLADAKAFAAFLAPLKRTSGSSMPSARSAGPRRCWPICRATPTASPSPTAGWSPPTRAASPSGQGLPHRRTGPLDDHDARHRRVHPPLPDPRAAQGFHRIRHYGLLAGTAKEEAIAKARDMLAAAVNPDTPEIDEDVAAAHAHPCPCCGGRMLIVELFEPGGQPQHQPINPKIRIDTS